MAARNKPYEQFGPYILFKKLEADSLGDLWRAGRIEDGRIAATVAMRRLSGGSREAFAAGTHAVSQFLPRLSGTSFVRDQQAGCIDGVPYVAWEYAGGRSLRHIIDRARGSKDSDPKPLPIDQAIVIAEKVALSLATLGDMRDTSGARLFHGALAPQFIWIGDDGEIRVAGQQLGGALMASMGDPKVAADVGRYFSPEYRASGQAQKNTDVYSMGAILFLLVTGHEPPDAASASAFVAAVRAGKTTTGDAIPDDLRVVLDKSFNLDPSMRYPSMTEMKQALSALANGGRYSATTFNLAFYLSSLLKKEMESEAAEREKESKLNVAPYLEAPKAAAPLPSSIAVGAEAPVLSAPVKKKSRLPLAIAAAVVVAAAGAGGYVMMTKNAAVPAAPVAAARLAPAPVVPLLPEPVVATPADEPADTGTATAAPADPEAQKKAFEDAVRQKMQAEMMKLQNEFMAELKQQQAKNAPVATPPQPAAPAEERPRMTAEQLDQQRLAARQEQAAAQRAPEPAAAAPVTQTTSAVQQTASVPAAPAVQPPPVQTPAVQTPAVRQGDVIDVAVLDSLPRPLRPIRPIYPPIAARQKVSATIILSAFIDEEGEVTDVRVLRGDARFGLNDAATRAIRSTRFSPPMKDGKRVRTWLPQTIEFVPN